MYKEKIQKFKVLHPFYVNDIDNLIEYYHSVEKSDFYNENILGGVRTKHIKESIKWLTETKKTFRSKATANKYKNAIVTLFRWLIEEGLENANFQSQYRMEPNVHKSYWYICNNYINNCDMLLSSKSLEALEKDAIEALLSDCDIAIGDYIDRGNKSMRVSFNNMLSALVVKLTLFTGIRYNKMRLIASSAFDKLNSTLKIDNIEIYIPFHEQLNEYLAASESFRKNYLFVEFNEQQLPRKSANSVLSHFLYKRVQSHSIEKIVKVGIQQLLMQNINETVIRRITGVEDTIMDSCFDALYNNHNWSSEINNALMKSNYYNYIS